jgi:uncharacterized protein (TIGR02145 family)
VVFGIVAGLLSGCGDNSTENGGNGGGGSGGGEGCRISSPSSGNVVPCPNAFTTIGSVACGGETYKTVNIGGQVWMAENLNYNVNGSRCYGNDPANCDKYGRLYDWATAMALLPSCNSCYCTSPEQPKHRGICPEGWHIPTDGEWETLIDFVGGKDTAGTKLKTVSGWREFNGSGNGTDEFGFAALPGGVAYTDSVMLVWYDGGFINIGVQGSWVSASEADSGVSCLGCGDGSGVSYVRSIFFSYKDARQQIGPKNMLLSVRCVQD